MKRAQILIDIEKNMSSVSLIEDGRLNEYYAEYAQNNLLTGNIYKGRIMNVLPGLQTAFVDIGVNKNAFLYVGETMDERGSLSKSGLIPDSLDIKEGDYVLVQVTKEETKEKGARLSMNLSLPGRNIVYLPGIDFAGVSGRITDENTRAKLIKLIEKIKKPGEGLIARTVCVHAKKSDITKEAVSLREMFEFIKEGYEKAEGVAQIHCEGNLLFRTVRDLLSPDIDAIICNDLNVAEELKRSFKLSKSPFYDLVKYYESDYDMLDVFMVTKELDKLLERKVNLPSGGTLVIDKTEALTAVDVNTGRFTGGADHEQTVFKTNLEAAREIARQLRLRNIGGLIVVDFIDMAVEEHKEEVVRVLREAVAFDRIKTRVMEMSGLGLVEITRKKSGNELSAFLLDECIACDGSGRQQSWVYLARKIKASLKKLFADNDYKNAFVFIKTRYIENILSSRFFDDECGNLWSGKRIYLVPDDSLKSGNFKISGNNQTMLELPQNAKLLY